MSSGHVPVATSCRLQILQEAPPAESFLKAVLRLRCSGSVEVSLGMPRSHLEQVRQHGSPPALQECRYCNAQGVALEALQRSAELGVVPSVKRFQTVMAWFGQQRAVENCCR